MKSVMLEDTEQEVLLSLLNNASTAVVVMETGIEEEVVEDAFETLLGKVA